MARALKVFCTPIGFHDAYVAAPSQKAALEAWGTDANLFARGMASVVTDPALMKQPLANPGHVIKRIRGTAEEHLAALPKSEPPTQRPADQPDKADRAKPAPKPSRQKLTAAEAALDRAQAKFDREAEAIRVREEALRAERHELNATRETEIDKLQDKLDAVRADYDDAMKAWRD